MTSLTTNSRVRSLGVGALLAVLFAFTATPAMGQMESGSGFKIGPRATIALGDLSDAGADFAIGADVRYDLSASVDAPIQLAGSFDFYFAEDIEAPDPQGGTQELSQTIFAVDLNGHYMIPTEGTFSPYAGAGLGIVRSSQDEVEVDTPFGTQTFGGGSNTDVGLNLVGGAEFETGSVRPFAQAQVSLGGDFTRFGITGGVLFSL